MGQVATGSIRSRRAERGAQVPGISTWHLVEHEPLQLDAWLTLALADEAILRLAGRFSRDLFVENVERETGRMPDLGVWPGLVLTPGRRVASPGCVLLRPDPNAPGGLAPASGWIVP